MQTVNPASVMSSKVSAGFKPVTMADHHGQAFDIVVSEASDHFETWLEEFKPFSPIAKLFSLILGDSGTLIDVGANIGTISVPVANRGSRVVSVEMLPYNCLKLTMSKALNGLDRMTIVQAAATDTNGLIEYSGDGPWAAISKALPSPHFATGYTLDTIMANLGDTLPAGLMAVKIDVEGHELEVLHGALETLDTYRPVVVFESIEGPAAENSRASRHFLQERGYKLFMLRDALPDSILSARDASDLQVGFLADYLAIPEERLQSVLATLEGYPIRDLKDDELLAWVQELAVSQQLVEHRIHAATVALHLSGTRSPGLRDALKPIIKALQKDADERVRTEAGSPIGNEKKKAS